MTPAWFQRRQSLNRLAGACCLGLSVLVTAVGAEEAAPPGEIVGFVCELEGDWTVELGREEPKKVELGQTLRAGARLRAQSTPARLAVAYADGTVETCSPSRECDLLPRSARSQTADDSLRERLSRVFERLFSLPEQHYAETLSRGSAIPVSDLVEAVLKGGGEVDLSPALRELAAGDYRLLLRPVAEGSTDQTRIDLQWRPAAAAPPKAALPPGLYRASEIDRSEWQIPTGRGSWLLVVPAESFHEAESQFRQLVETASGWRDPLGHDRSRALLRAALEILAEDHGVLPPPGSREDLE